MNNLNSLDKMFGLYKMRHNSAMNASARADKTITRAIYYLLSLLWPSDRLTQLYQCFQRIVDSK